MPVVLDALDDIDWAQLGHAYGPARDVPEQLRALTSADATARARALHDLYGNIFHQGTRYQATAYAVPFLLELVAAVETPDRANVARLLSDIAIGYDSSWLPGTVQVAQLRDAARGGEAVLAKAPPPEDDEDDEEADEEEGDADDDEGYLPLTGEEEARLYTYLELRAYDAVRAGVPVFLDLLEDPDPRLQTVAAYALGWFPEDAAAILPRLTGSALDSEICLATAQVSIGLLGGRPDPALLADPRPLVRWGAAVGLRDEAELVTWVTDGAPADPRIPFLDGDLGGLASLALGELGAETAFGALLTRIPAVTGTAALPPVSVALRLAFPDGLAPGTEASALTDRQRQLAQALADSPNTWLYNGMTFGNFSQLVGYYGLPRSSDKLRAFLQD